MKSCHVIQSNFYTMETLLIKWLVDLQGQQVPTPEKCLQWQAYAVHRMLSGLSHEPLPPHKFSSDWLSQFKERNYLEEGKPSNKIVVKDASLKLAKLQRLLRDYAMDDIYFCDVTSIFALPACVSSHRGRACQLLSRRQRTISSCERGPGVSLLLFCNASGTVKREPVMLDRLFQTSPGLRRMTFAGWLVAFNKQLVNNVLLLVSVAVWEQIKDRLRGLALTKVRIEAVPAQLNAWLPMRTGIAREFKAYVNAMNFEWTLNASSPGGNIYQVAMQQVQASVIQQCFRRFKNAVQGLEPSEQSEELSPAQRRLKDVLTVAHGEEDKSNKGVFEYYLNQGSDIGPSAFLCAEIQMMLSSSDVEGFLDASGHGTRPVGDWWKFVVVNQ
ncbi:hypothetical protein BGZ90_010156 [Linnemannia elongata]|nr:hypothetical protein BGZ90_010156 [Linnemannia elongata]